jgi:hypothetical protein
MNCLNETDIVYYIVVWSYLKNVGPAVMSPMQKLKVCKHLLDAHVSGNIQVHVLTSGKPAGTARTVLKILRNFCQFGYIIWC